MPRPVFAAIAERSLRTGAYAVVTVSGIASILWTPRTIADVLGAGTATVWGVFLLLGGALCMFASVTERYLIEHPAILLVVAGLCLYLVALWEITLDGELSRLTQTSVITAYALHLLARHVQLRRLAGALTPKGG